MLEPLIVFALGYIIGGVTALILIALTLAGRDSSTRQHRPTTTKHP
jgi:hypothetical protein